MKSQVSTIIGISAILFAACDTVEKRPYTASFEATNNSNLAMEVQLSIYESPDRNNSCDRLESNFRLVIPPHESGKHENTIYCHFVPDTWIKFNLLNSKSVTLSDFSWRVRRDADSKEEYENLKPLANLFRPGKVLTWEGDVSGTHSVDLTKYFETEANSPNLPKSVFPDLDSVVKIGVLNYRSSFFDPSEYYFEPYINIDHSLDTKITASIEFDEGDRSFYQLQSSGQVTMLTPA